MNSFDSIFHGTVSIRHEDKMYQPLRLSDYQLERYKSLPRCVYPYATAGITLEFTTSAEEISFGYSISKTWKWWPDSDPRIDIFENGILIDTLMLEYEPLNTVKYIKYKRQWSKGRTEYRIYLPCNAQVQLCDFDLGDDWEPVPMRQRKFLVLSDSIGQGLMGNSPALSYAATVARFFDAELLNPAVGGDCFDETAIDENIDYTPTDIILALGTNDVSFYKDYDLIKDNIPKYFEKVSKIYAGADVTVLSPLYFTDAPERPDKFELMVRVNDDIHRLAEQYGWRNVRGFDMYPHHPRFYSDRTHPNDLGFSQYALGLIKAICYPNK